MWAELATFPDTRYNSHNYTALSQRIFASVSVSTVMFFHSAIYRTSANEDNKKSNNNNNKERKNRKRKEEEEEKGEEEETTWLRGSQLCVLPASISPSGRQGSIRVYGPKL